MLLHQSDVVSALFSSWSASASVEKRRCAACFILLSPLALALPDQPLAALTALLLLFILGSTLLCKQSRSVQLRCVRQNRLYYAVMMPALLFIVHSKQLAPGLQALITFFFPAKLPANLPAEFSVVLRANTQQHATSASLELAARLAFPQP